MKIAKWQSLLICLATTLACGCKTETETSIVRPVRAIKVGDVAGFNALSFPGRAKAADEVNLAFRVSGELDSLPIDIGMKVNQGDLLGRLDQRDFEAAVSSRRADLEQAVAKLDAMKIARPEEIRRLEAEVREAEAVLALAKTEYERNVASNKKLAGSVAQSVVDRSKGGLDRSAAMLDQAKESLLIAREGARLEDIRSQEAEVQSFQAKLTKTENDLGYTKLTAPFVGTIAGKYVENFQAVQAGAVVCRLLGTSKIEIIIDVSEGKIGLAPYVKDIVCIFDAFPDVPILGAKITEIGTEASATTRTYSLTLSMDQPDPSTGATILPGMAGRVSGTAQINEEIQAEGFVIPESAIFEGDDGQKHVWLIDEDQMEAHLSDPVTPGQLSPLGVRVKGIQPGQWVAIAGVHYIEEGQPLRILPDENAASAPPVKAAPVKTHQDSPEGAQ